MRREKIKTVYRLLFTQNKLFYLRYVFLISSLIIISLGIFKISYFGENQSSWESQDVVFVLDVSKSMNTIDIKQGSYSRLDYSKIKISEYMSKYPQNRYGLVIFAGDALSLSPLSNNIDHLLTNLSQVNYTNIAKQWTNLESALELGYARFWISDWNTGKALIVISDGWDSDDTIDSTILSNINPDEIASFVFWVWSGRGWAIPIGKDPFWEIVFQTYQWQQVITKINTSLLKDLADSIDGEYNSLEDLWDQLDTIEKKALQNSLDAYKKSIANILWAISLILFILYLLFPYIWKTKQ